MSAVYEGALQDLVEEFGKLPGIGPKSAQRLAFHILQTDEQDVSALAQALTDVKQRVRFCDICGNVSEEAECTVCQDPRRDRSVICVGDEHHDVVALERTPEYRGLNYVRGGAIDPMAGVGPDKLRIRDPMTRLQNGEVKEAVIATDPNREGEATATYLV